MTSEEAHQKIYFSLKKWNCGWFGAMANRVCFLLSVRMPPPNRAPPRNFNTMHIADGQHFRDMAMAQHHNLGCRPWHHCCEGRCKTSRPADERRRKTARRHANFSKNCNNTQRMLKLGATVLFNAVANHHKSDGDSPWLIHNVFENCTGLFNCHRQCCHLQLGLMLPIKKSWARTLSLFTLRIASLLPSLA